MSYREHRKEIALEFSQGERNIKVPKNLIAKDIIALILL